MQLLYFHNSYDAFQFGMLGIGKSDPKFLFGFYRSKEDNSKSISILFMEFWLTK